jgi:purine-binding chemotaxis protein CheW
MIETWQQERTAEAEGPEPSLQYLCFWLGGQSYALPVAEVQEIRAVGSSSSLPGSPPWVLGVMNLRGLVIPLFDLRLRFAISAPAAGAAQAPVLIVISANAKLAGLVVDGVMDVTDIAPGAVHGSTHHSGADARCVAGVASLGESVVIVLNASELMNWDLAAPGEASGA